MAALSVRQIRELAHQIVIGHPGGIRYRDIVAEILARHPDANQGTVQVQVANNLVDSYPTEITKPSRGLYKPILESPAPSPVVEIASRHTLREEDIYQPFATYLRNDLEEATEALPIGGASQRSKWGTPDVVGVYRPLASQFIKFTPEIVAAEVKLDPQQPVVAFGQAVAYRLFATRSYVVMPAALSAEDQSRLEALCMLFSVGFVLFEPTAHEPKFEIRVRALSVPPDMFYVNEFARRLHETHPDVFQKLFG